MPTLLVEPGFSLHAASGSGAPTVRIDSAKLSLVVASARNVNISGSAAGPRVALLDTGLARAGQEMADFKDGRVQTISAEDAHGHGTAMTQVIEAVKPNARVYPVRVLSNGKKGKSYELLVGLAFALWSGQFDVISASVTTDAAGMCETSLGKSLDYLLAMARTNPNDAVPLLVAAAGNSPSKSSGYPAVLLDAVVVVAQQRDPSGSYVRADYNSTPPPGARVHEAYGGDPGDSLGDVTPTGSTTAQPQWGTSFAAAAVAGACIPEP
ncbi:MAG: S8 family serine peptidase [Acidimicrobiales bacterium]